MRRFISLLFNGRLLYDWAYAAIFAVGCAVGAILSLS